MGGRTAQDGQKVSTEEEGSNGKMRRASGINSVELKRICFLRFPTLIRFTFTDEKTREMQTQSHVVKKVFFISCENARTSIKYARRIYFYAHAFERARSPFKL